MMTFSKTIHLIKSDFYRYYLEHDAKKKYLHIFLANPGLWVLVNYRLRQYVHAEFRVPILRQVFIIILALKAHVLKFMTCIELPLTVEIGHGCFIPHIGTIIINYQTRMGNNCTIVSGVTIGVGGRGERKGVPVIGSQVYIGPGAKLIGPITIGDNVTIGANAVVVNDVPDNAVVAGIPAEIKNYKGSFDFIKCDVPAYNLEAV